MAWLLSSLVGLFVVSAVVWIIVPSRFPALGAGRSGVDKAPTGLVAISCPLSFPYSLPSPPGQRTSLASSALRLGCPAPLSATSADRSAEAFPHSSPLRCAVQRSGKNILPSAVIPIVHQQVIITTLFYPLAPTQLDALITAVGLLLYFVGLSLAVWAKLTLKGNWGPAGEDIDQKRQRHLVTTGPYAFSRNPIYIAVFLFTVGLFIALRSYLIFLVLFPTINFFRAATKEEIMLEQHYGQEYLNYKARVPKFL
jgi:protein-S-isoprenylcysteine O-methyltransferase Ste14